MTRNVEIAGKMTARQKMAEREVSRRSAAVIMVHHHSPHAETRFKAKHSLDSDEEDEEDEVQQEGLGDEDLAAQEDSSTVVSNSSCSHSFTHTLIAHSQGFDGGIQVTPFNLKEEMEEG